MPAHHTPSSRSPSSATLVARDLSLDRGGRTVLNGVSVTVGPEHRIGVIGPNGVGKSSLLLALSGQLDPDLGTVTSDPPSATVGYLAQEHDVTPGVGGFKQSAQEVRRASLMVS